MKPPVAYPVGRTNATVDHDESIRHLPADARAAFDRFQSSGDLSELDPVVLAILEDFTPRTLDRRLAEFPAATRLAEDLGFDSLAITEVVFFTEDLLGIKITNQEIKQVRTLEDLRRFVHRKVALSGGSNVCHLLRRPD